MKLSKSTIETLKNFAQISDGVVLLPGKEQSVYPVSETILAEATLEDDIPKKAPIHDLGKFLSAISQLDDPDIHFNDNNVTLCDDDIEIVWYHASEETIYVKPGEFILDEIDASFNLSKDALSKILKISGLISNADIVIEGKGPTIWVKAINPRSDSSNVASIEISSDETLDLNFSVRINIENLILIPDDYKVSLKEKRFITFESETRRYVVTLEIEN